MDEQATAAALDLSEAMDQRVYLCETFQRETPTHIAQVS
jgi:hypothetical protein